MGLIYKLSLLIFSFCRISKTRQMNFTTLDEDATSVGSPDQIRSDVYGVSQVSQHISMGSLSCLVDIANDSLIQACQMLTCLVIYRLS